MNCPFVQTLCKKEYENAHMHETRCKGNRYDECIQYKLILNGLLDFARSKPTKELEQFVSIISMEEARRRESV